MTDIKTVTLHHEVKLWEYEEVTLELRPAEFGNHGRTSTWDVYRDGELLGQIERTQGHVERVPIAKGSRIGKDLRPRTVWRSRGGTESHFFPGLYFDTRNIVLGHLLGHRSHLEVHLPGRGRRWQKCNLCEGS